MIGFRWGSRYGMGHAMARAISSASARHGAGRARERPD